MNTIISILTHEFTLSVALVLVVYVIRTMVDRRIRGDADILSEAQRQSLSRLRNTTIAATAVGLIIIWSTELKGLALSLAAFAVAIVLASKELIVCISGSILLRSGERSFKVGDWIEVGEYHGEVIDHNLFSTTLQDVSISGNRSYTGKTLVLPNSLFLSHPLINHNFAKRFLFHTFELPVSEDSDWRHLIAKMEDSIHKLGEPHMDAARDYVQSVERNAGIDIPDPDPKVRIKADGDGKFRMLVTAFCPPDKVIDIEDTLARDLLDEMASGGNTHEQ